ncbi:hypothetical protein [Niastella vici]|uniref:hypothetical protein n=1 Tax=Niastella vici TaxID=1703345 RepID=UPI001180CBF3|nr:hypothetical protein [Niastella vici]
MESEFNSRAIQQQISPTINDFLTRLPSTSRVTDFLNTPNNTYYFEIVNNKYIKGITDDEFKNARACLSTIILERFCREEVDDSSLFTLLIYLQLTVLKTSVQSTEEFVLDKEVWIKNYLDVSSLKFNDLLSEKEVKALFLSNKSILYEIYGQVNKNPIHRKLNWLTKWEEVCLDFFHARRDIADARIALLNLINRHLGISDFKFYICLNMLQHLSKQISVNKQRT